MAKVLVSLPDDLLARIDERARARGLSRSGLLADMARRQLARPTPEEIDAAIERIQTRFRDAGPLPFDSAELIRRDRDTRDNRHNPR